MLVKSFPKRTRVPGKVSLSRLEDGLSGSLPEPSSRPSHTSPRPTHGEETYLKNRKLLGILSAARPRTTTIVPGRRRSGIFLLSQAHAGQATPSQARSHRARPALRPRPLPKAPSRPGRPDPRPSPSRPPPLPPLDPLPLRTLARPAPSPPSPLPPPRARGRAARPARGGAPPST